MPLDLDVSAIPRDRIPALIAALAARLLLEPEQSVEQATQTEADDEMLTTEEAAAMLRRSPRWIYRNARRLPFIHRPSPRSMLHSKKGIARYLASHKA